MSTYISILRGINVSGQKKIKMADLKEHYEAIGFTNVQTYIQSGNVIFDSEKPIEKLPGLIHSKIERVYGFSVPVLVRTREALIASKENNPYLQQSIPVEKLLITFLEHPTVQERIDAIDHSKYLPDEFIIDGKHIYLHIAGGYGKSKLSNNFFENKLKVAATTRNIKTVNKLIELSER